MAHCRKNLVVSPSELKRSCKTDSRTTAGHKNCRHDTTVAKGRRPSVGPYCVPNVPERKIVLAETPLLAGKHPYTSWSWSKRISDRGAVDRGRRGTCSSAAQLSLIVSF